MSPLNGIKEIECWIIFVFVTKFQGTSNMKNGTDIRNIVFMYTKTKLSQISDRWFSGHSESYVQSLYMHTFFSLPYQNELVSLWIELDNKTSVNWKFMYYIFFYLHANLLIFKYNMNFKCLYNGKIFLITPNTTEEK